MNIVEQQFYDVLPSIAAESAALRVKLKQQYDLTSVIRNDIRKADLYIESFKRDNERYDELLETKAQEFTKLEEELANLSISREHIQSNTDNLKKQYELILIGDEQRRKEQDLVRSNYETMIKNRREIFNSSRLVVRRNNLKNHCEAARIQSSVLEERLHEVERQIRQFREIQNLNLKSVSIQLAEVWVNNKKEKEKLIVLRNKLREKQELLNQLLAENKEQVTPTQRSPRSQLVSLPIPSPSPPIQIPSLKNDEDNDLTKYFQKINLFKKGRSPFLLPPLLSRGTIRKEKELLGSPKASSTFIDSPVKKITSSDSDSVKILEVEKTVSDPPKITDTSEPIAHKIAFQPITPKQTEPKNVEPEIISVNDKPNHMFILLGNHSPKIDSPGKIKSTRLMDRRVSPLTVSRMSPLNVSNKSPKSASRIPVPVSSGSPIRSTSRIPVRFTPLKVNQKRDQDKENVRRPEMPKRVAFSSKNIDIDTSDTCKSKTNQSQGGAKRLDVGSPKRGIKYPKMDYAFIQNAHKTSLKIYPDDDSVEPPLMEVDQLDNQITRKFLYKNEKNFEYDEVFNENNPMIRSYTERLKMIREGHAKKDIRKEKHETDDIEKTKKLLKDKKSDFVERELYEVNDARHLFKNIDISKEKYNEFAKHYEKFQPHDVRKDEHAEPKDFRDTEKPKSEFSVKEAISRIDKKEETVRKLPEKLDVPEVDYDEYEDSFHANPDLYLDTEERLSKSCVSNDNRNRSEVFSPFSNVYSISPPGSNNFSTPFVPMGERGSMFSFGSSVNQLFGSTDGTSGQSKNPNNGFFGFNFSSSVDKPDEPFKLF